MEQRRRHKCPYCLAVQVKRIATGIWHCRKCNTKFTGKAYSVERKITAEDEQPAQEQVQPEEAEELEAEEEVENG